MPNDNQSPKGDNSSATPTAGQNLSDTDDTDRVTSPVLNSDKKIVENPDTPIVTAPEAPEKYGGKKAIATIFGILILVGGVATGVLLVQRAQELREKAASGSECQQSPDCDLVDNAANQGSYTASRPITHAFITDQVFHRYAPGDSDDGCRRVTISGNFISWNRYGSGSDCKDVSNVQVWLGEAQPTPTATPTPTTPPGATATPTESITSTPTPTTPLEVNAECSSVKTYDTDWNLISNDDLKDLKSGDSVRFTVSGSSSGGFFDKARFTVNGSLKPEVSSKKPGSNEFYYEYMIPEGVINFTIKGEVHHSSLGWI